VRTRHSERSEKSLFDFNPEYTPGPRGKLIFLIISSHTSAHKEKAMFRRKQRFRLATLFSLMLIICPRVLSQADVTVSLIQLIANPEKYDGERFGIIGFLRLEFEGNRLYLHEEDYKNAITENSVAIDVTRKQRQDFEDRNMHYVLLFGTFKTGQRGSSQANGAMTDIKSIASWPIRR
jgi:hypothetical protein